MPTRIRKLKEQAIMSCTKRCHTMKNFTTIKFSPRQIFTSTCKYCGMYVQVVPKPYSNETNISGNAIALTCTHDNRMMIKIVDQPIVIDGRASYNSYRQKINEVAGCWLEVDTEFLFKDQFNTTSGKHPGANLRIMLYNVAEIKNDVRVNRKFCKYCHHHAHIDDKVCTNCKHDDYFENFFPQVKHGKV
jgi:hypothetical protein